MQSIVPVQIDVLPGQAKWEKKYIIAYERESCDPNHLVFNDGESRFMLFSTLQ